MTSIEDFAQLMGAFQQVTQNIGGKARWGTRRRAYRQTTLDHSLTMGILTAFCLEIERDFGKVKLDELALITHAMIHDFCEGGMGDMTYEFKSDPRIKWLHHKLEQENAQKVFASFAAMATFLTERHQLAEGSEEEAFFNAMERLEYMLYAVHEAFVHNHLEFADVLIRHHDKLVEYAERFGSIASLYSQEVQDWVVAYVKKHEAITQNASIPLPAPEHLKDLLTSAKMLTRTLLENGVDPKQIEGLWRSDDPEG